MRIFIIFKSLLRALVFRAVILLNITLRAIVIAFRDFRTKEVRPFYRFLDKILSVSICASTGKLMYRVHQDL